MLGKNRGCLDVHMTSESTDCDVIARVADVRQVIDSPNVNQHRWLCKTEFHEWHEAVAAGQKFGLIAMLAKKGDGFVGR